jgi:hypothetical protein
LDTSGATSVLPAPVSDFAPPELAEPEGELGLLLEPHAATPAATMIAVAAVVMRRLVNFDLLGLNFTELP